MSISGAVLALCALSFATGASAARSLRVLARDGASSEGTPSGLQNQNAAVPQLPAPPAAAGAPGVKPQLFFLFMVYVKINNEEVWDRFFSSAVRGIDYQALVHCKSEAACKSNIKSLRRFEIISSVATAYCFNLVGGMNALLKAALLRAGAGTPFDKFVFVSDSTLPVKPFPYVYRHLTGDSDSDFCVFPRNEWAEVSETYLNAPLRTPVRRVAVKHHQWIILSRRHAAESVKREGDHQDLMEEFQLNMGFGNTGCLDEFWHFLVIYRALELTGRPETVHLEGFGGGPLSTTMSEVQGRCRTFAHWVPRASGAANNATFLAGALSRDPGTDMAPASETRPASIARLSQPSLAELRSSPFLFVRKVEDFCEFSGCESLAKAFDQLVFAPSPKALPGLSVPWRGAGQWLDTQRSNVAITSQSGTLHLAGANAGMTAKGSYCKDSISVVFMNGFKAKAELSSDGILLKWDNGATWGRVTDASRGLA
mmetsp:Transcript_120566/g.375381  ORF Transcript_120566/g.375381 Transcript_120566/m.375381 type:complete len:483 (+) Transcript_120566:87-1535(+)|eukprot:CAMPEP_0204542322 /NCGR_PEP_ID=MMETSP0661-20131031/18872_1 /ASSEMBLY_ACC=CAM_ASM_000606 /TAXON_ID=109239 /ORGANISM="Alexandrium margalefi, Strain AMGDE01CS-322" /LENGTH=482 /DNA_ID=CAMNT_0051549027 /DNA_START=40 /DNA_END=1488 /DNA_ORIENTATION=-